MDSKQTVYYIFYFYFVKLVMQATRHYAGLFQWLKNLNKS